MEVEQLRRRYGFVLDRYQLEAIEHLEKGRSVLVAAPTGSGKTVIAEHALELARRDGQKFFYTTPIKALSNQKFRDLSEIYPPGEVGLLTGDNSINGDAPIVVMTTEVLRNMIYEQSPVLDELGVVVLDEVHYMQDPSRGGVWEEIVILLPRGITLVGLSATVSNVVELGDWMDSLRGDVRVVVSSERPVKLKNYYYIGRALTPLFSKNLPRIIEEQYEYASKTDASYGNRRGRGRGRGLVPKRSTALRELQRREMLPAIYFLFSRAACNDSVQIWMREGVSLTSKDEKRQIADYIDEKLGALEDSDLECLKHDEFRAALVAGVAAHHAGLLPLFKEAVEELFSRGLIKVVFATETLALGINMPARSVVIESLSKWDGESHRPMTPGEYRQLTGRAGRRGIDKTGNAVVLHQRFFSTEQVRTLVRKEPSPVVSSFEISYNMVVNLLSEYDPEECQRLLNLSFAQFTADRRVVSLESRLESLQSEYDKLLVSARCPDADAMRYRQFERELARISRKRAVMSKNRRRKEITEAMVRLQPGDVFLASRGSGSRVLAVVRKHRGGEGAGEVLVVDSSGRYRRLSPASFKHPPTVIGAVEISRITSPTRKVRRSVAEKMDTLRKEARLDDRSGGPGAEEQELTLAVEFLTEELENSRCHNCLHSARCLESARKAEKIEQRIISARKERDSGFDVVSRRFVDLMEVLHEFRFLAGERPTPKGEMLRKVYNQCDLVLVDLLSEGDLSALSPRELVAFVSWFIYESRDGDEGQDREAEEFEYLGGSLGQVHERVMRFIGSLKSAESAHGIDLTGSIDVGFSETAFMWGGGVNLEEMLNIFPDQSIGDMVRIMKQLIDLLRQLAEVTDDRDLRRNLRTAMDLVDRGIVGYSSLESVIERETPI